MMLRRRLTPTAALVLSVLLEESMHPYEILTRLAHRRDDRLVRLSPGAVYHAVDKLHAAGLIVESGSERRGNRPERTMYAITEAGRIAHADRTWELLVDRSREYPAFPVGLALMHDLEADAAADCLRRRRDDLAAEVSQRHSRLDEIVHSGLPKRLLLDAFYEINQARAEVEWLTATIADLESGALSWTQEPVGPFLATSSTDIDKETR